VSFLIGPDGKVKKVYPKVDPGVHADEILHDAGVTT
jgi:peroxiredoxin Q/BCP